MLTKIDVPFLKNTTGSATVASGIHRSSDIDMSSSITAEAVKSGAFWPISEDICSPFLAAVIVLQSIKLE